MKPANSQHVYFLIFLVLIIIKESFIYKYKACIGFLLEHDVNTVCSKYQNAVVLRYKVSSCLFIFVDVVFT